MWVNPQRCVICGGQDGVLVLDSDRDSDSAFVHPYCKRSCKQVPEPIKN